MEFNANKSIYLQIADAICEKILSGEFKSEDRILSVREYGAEIGVNPNTVMRSYEKLTNDGIIYNKRGIGYFVSPDAREKVLSTLRREFFDTEWPSILRKMHLLGITLSDLRSPNFSERYENFTSALAVIRCSQLVGGDKDMVKVFKYSGLNLV